jgi:hypothetical protein
MRYRLEKIEKISPLLFSLFFLCSPLPHFPKHLFLSLHIYISLIVHLLHTFSLTSLYSPSKYPQAAPDLHQFPFPNRTLPNYPFPVKQLFLA